MHRKPGPRLRCMFQSACDLDWGPHEGLRQGLLRQQDIRFRTSVRPFWRQTDWFAVQKSTCPMSAATRWPVMTQDAIQFSGAVFVGSGRSIPACFTIRRVTPLPVPPLPGPRKGPARKSPAAPLPPGRRRLWCQGWPAVRMTTPVWVTSTVRHKRTMSACGIPPLESSQTPPNPQVYWSDRYPLPPCLWQNSQGTGSL